MLSGPVDEDERRGNGRRGTGRKGFHKTDKYFGYVPYKKGPCRGLNRGRALLVKRKPPARPVVLDFMPIQNPWGRAIGRADEAEGTSDGLHLDEVGVAGLTGNVAAGDDDIVALLQVHVLLGHAGGLVEQHLHGGVFLHQHRSHGPGQGQLPVDLGIRGHADDGAGAAEPGHHPGGGAGDRADHNAPGVYVHGHGAGGMGNGVQGILDLKVRVPEPVGVADMLLRELGDLGHVPDGLHGVLARGGLAGEHDGGAAVIDGVGHVGDLRPGGTGILDHGFQHFRGGDDPLAHHAALVDEELLNGGDLHKGDLHAKVAPGHHDAVADLTDVLDIIHAGPVLDLGDDIDLLAAVFPEEVLHILHILTGGHKGGGHEVHIVPDAEEQVRLVLLAEEGAGHEPVGEVHALPVGQVAAGQDLTDRVAALQGRDLEHHKAVVHQDPVPYGQVLNEALIGDGDPGLVALHILGGEGEGVAVVQVDLSVLEGLDPVLGALGVQHDGDGQAQLLPDLFDEVHLFLLLLMGAVGEIQPGHVHAGQAHLGQGLLVLAGRADGADDLCFAHDTVSSPTQSNLEQL